MVFWHASSCSLLPDMLDQNVRVSVTSLQAMSPWRNSITAAGGWPHTEIVL